MMEFNLLNDGIVWLADNLESELNKFDSDTGRFLEEGGGWTVVNQDIMLTMAYLYLTDHPDNRYFQSERLLRMIEKAGDALRDFQYPDGQFEFLKVDGSKWGPVYMPWTMYHWLETYHQMNHHLDEERRERWAQGLRLAYGGICRELSTVLEKSHVQNMHTWNAMGLHRAAQVFHESEWNQMADMYIGLTVEQQNRDGGYWFEFTGPTTLYNYLYIHPLGLYRFHGGSFDVLPALERSLRFHEIFSYPDGSKVETIDGRVKYIPHPYQVGLVGLAHLPKGRRLVERFVQLAMQQQVKWSYPHFTELLYYWNKTETESAVKEQLNVLTLFEQDCFQIVHANALVVKEQGWYVCLSGYTAPAVEWRWGLDRQSFVGVWNAADGLIIGGGNSKDQPEWSTFELQLSGGVHSYIPHAGKVDSEQRKVGLVYGENGTCEIQLSSLSKEQICLSFRAPLEDGEKVVVHIPLKLQLDGSIATSLGTDEVVTANGINLDGQSGRHWIRHRHWKLELEGPFHLQWPSYPFNPYDIDGKANISEAIAVMTIPLTAGVAKEIAITIAGDLSKCE